MAFELILIIMGTLFMFFFLPWVAKQLLKFIPVDRWDWELKVKKYGRFFR